MATLRTGLPPLTAMPSSPSWIQESLMVTSVARPGSMPSVLRTSAGDLMRTPQTVKPVPPR
ncbi:hypothetical protein BIV25_21745 [Streptomyces sp. MUSC 14]|nr:hypothetical protein BIV25_21745 [Streptomyces sp. MUSC 14]